MNLLVTGACGLVGAALVEAAARTSGGSVVAFDRSDPPHDMRDAWSGLPGDVTFVKGDLNTSDTLTDAFAGYGIAAVIHAATVTSGPERDADSPETVINTNVIGTINVLKAFRESGAKRFVYVSSNAVYGTNSLNWPALDDASTVCDPRSLYAVSKFAAERTALRLGDLWEADVRIARLGSVFGPWERDTGVRDTLNPMLQTTLSALRGEEAVLERPCRRDWIYSRDVATALLSLAGSSSLKHDVYNVGPGIDRSWTVADWCDRLAHVFPAFRYRLADPGEQPNINLHGSADRAPLNTARLLSDTQFRPAFDLDHAFEDVRRWMEKYPTAWA